MIEVVTSASDEYACCSELRNAFKIGEHRKRPHGPETGSEEKMYFVDTGVV